MSGETASLIIFIIIVSTLFPLGGYYLDYRHNRKMNGEDKK